MARKKVQVRKTKNTQSRLPVRQLSVAAQGAAALALGLGLAAPAPAEASIVYTDITDFTITKDGAINTYYLDLTNSGNNQFIFSFPSISYSYPGYFSIDLRGPNVQATSNNGVAGTYFPMFLPMYAAFNLPKGTPINYYYQNFSNNAFFAAEGKLSYYGFDIYFKAGQWIGKQGYAGLLFYDEENDLHFGWVELSVAADLNSLTIYGFAYESDPDTPINAGAVPVPSSLLLMASGALGVLAYRRRRQNREQQPD